MKKAIAFTTIAMVIIGLSAIMLIGSIFADSENNEISAFKATSANSCEFFLNEYAGEQNVICWHHENGISVKYFD